MKTGRRSIEAAPHVRVARHLTPASRVLRDAGWGVAWGLGGACFFSLYVIGSYAFRGAAFLEHHGLTLAGVLAIYFGVGIVGGAVIGLLRPLLRWRAGAFVVGTAAAFPLAISLGVLKHGHLPGVHWRAAVGLLILAAGTGGIVGALVWQPQDREQDS